MKIAVTSTGPTLDSDVEARFGRCAYFLIIDADTMQFEAIENPNIALGGGAGIQSAQLMSEKGVTTVLTGNCGPNAFNVFGQAGIQVIVGVSGNIRNAVEQFKAGKYSSADAPNVQSHFGVSSGQQPDQTQPSGSNNPPMGNPGMGMGRGGGRGRGMGGGRGMGRGMGMGMRATMPGAPAGPDVFQSSNIPTAGQSELDQLKQQAQILQQQKQEIEKRISELESGRKAAAFIQTDKCTACGICANVCPNNAISIDKYAVVNPKLCTACAVCVSECPNGAITITQQKIES
ncbi:MAG TPA: 4Fe-4S dicluster domain-containing protein [Desulfobacteraceae bacterium]|nr:4Fe-4S dicluster domain-containing protein [Desulfobacteraceae bacterium]